MRTDVIEYLQTQNFGTFIVSTELPFSESGVPLYIVEPIISTLSGVNITRDTVAVTVYLANDAKSLTPNYDEVVGLIRAAKDILPTAGFSSREVDVQTSFEADKLITQIELRYIKLT